MTRTGRNDIDDAIDYTTFIDGLDGLNNLTIKRRSKRLANAPSNATALIKDNENAGGSTSATGSILRKIATSSLQAEADATGAFFVEINFGSDDDEGNRDAAADNRRAPRRKQRRNAQARKRHRNGRDLPYDSKDNLWSFLTSLRDIAADVTDSQENMEGQDGEGSQQENREQAHHHLDDEDYNELLQVDG